MRGYAVLVWGGVDTPWELGYLGCQLSFYSACKLKSSVAYNIFTSLFVQSFTTAILSKQLSCLSFITFLSPAGCC